MPANERKVVQIILEEVQHVEERCDGYRMVLADALSDIVTAERQHRIRGTNIQQQVNHKCNATGEYLAERRANS